MFRFFSFTKINKTQRIPSGPNNRGEREKQLHTEDVESKPIFTPFTPNSTFHSFLFSVMEASVDAGEQFRIKLPAVDSSAVLGEGEKDKKEGEE